MDKLRVNITGYGIMGKRRHNIIKEEFKDVAEVVSIYDTDESKVPDGFEESDNLDVAFICSPTSERSYDIFPDAKYFYVEKPAAGSLKETMQLMAKYGGRLKMGTNFLHIPTVEELTKIVLEVNDRPLYIRAKVGHDGEKWVPGWRSEFYRGCLLDNGVHVIDLVSRLFGIAETCRADTYHLKWTDITAEDYAVATFKWSDGMILNLQTSWCETDGYCLLEMQYKDICLLADMRDAFSGLWKVKNRDKTPIAIPGSSPVYSHYVDMKQFFDIVQNSGHFLGYRDRYVNDMKMIESAYASEGNELKI